MNTNQVRNNNNLHVKMPQQLRDKITDAANARGLSDSAFVKVAVHNYLQELEQ